ncbi:hypothetical protein BDD12DRAFT_722082, partial [Trichophaea hybrida]
ITIPPASRESINSVQNSLLLTSDAHTLFDSYNVSINPSVPKRPSGRGLTEAWPIYEIQTCYHAGLIIGGFLALNRQI